MSTLEDVVRMTIANTAAASDLGLPLVFRWVEQRYREVTNRTHLRFLRHWGELSYPAPIINDGTVTVTFGSNVVVGNNTHFGRQHVGWFFRFNLNWYRINDVQGQTLILQSPFAETLTNVTGYTLVQRFLPLDANVQWVGTIAHPRLFRLLLERTMNWLDHREASRILVAAFPTVWAEGPDYRGDYATTGLQGQGVSNTLAHDWRKTVEIYPYSSQQEFYTYTYWERLPDQRLESILPPEVDPYMLYEGAKADVYEYMLNMALKGPTPNPQTAAVYGGLRREAFAVWEQKLQQLVVKDAIALDEDVELWSDYDMAQLSDIDSAYDNYISRLGIITVQ